MNLIFSKVITAATILGILIVPAAGSGAPYEIISHEGYVAVRSAEGGKLRVTGTRTALLPLEDQLLLSAGIPCENAQRVLGVLENFCS